MSLQLLSLLYTFDSCDFVNWDATVHYVINAMDCCMVLNGKLFPIIKDGTKTDESTRTRNTWDNQDI